MNSLLADPFAQDYPEALLHTLTACQASCLKFSSHHIACGTVGGEIVLYDLITLNPARILRGHCRTVQSIAYVEYFKYTTAKLMETDGQGVVNIFSQPRVTGFAYSGI